MPKKGIIRVATCQFAVGGNVRRNAAQIRKQIEQAAREKADVVHFPEAALTGYVGTDFPSWDGFDWDALRTETESICRLAKKHKCHVLLGSAHRLSGNNLPHNSVYVIDSKGKVVERYDKRFCTGGDLKHYSPGNHFAVFDVNGVKCSILICYDVRFPELYRELKKRGVQALFQSFYNARARRSSIHTIIMPATVQARAATNYMWISATNASGYYQSWPCVLSQPDGRIVGRLKQHRPGVMVNEINTQRQFYDAAGPNRDLAMKGILHNGELVRDKRSANRESL
jgi:predicted amidohydrolase